MQITEIIAKGLLKRNAQRIRDTLEFVTDPTQIPSDWDKIEEGARASYSREADAILKDLAEEGFYVVGESGVSDR